MSSSTVTTTVNERFSWTILAGLCVILFIAGSARLAMFEYVYAIDETRIVQSDTIRYEGPAIALLNTGTMRDGLDIVHTQDVHEAPAYPYFIYRVYKQFGQSHRALVYAQIAVSLGTILLLYFIGCALWSRSIALLGSAVLAIAPMQSLYTGILLSETLFVFFIVLMFWCGVRFLQTYASAPSVICAALFGLSLGAASMVRPVAYYLVFCVVIALVIYHFIIKQQKFLTLIKCSAALLIGFAVVVGPWQVRNKAITGAYLFTDNPGQIMLYWKAAGMIADRDGIDETTVRAQLLSEMPTEFESIAQKHAMEQQKGVDIILSDIPAYLKFTGRTLVRILIGPGVSKFGLYFDGDQAGLADSENNSAAWLTKFENISGYKLWYAIIIAYSLGFILLLYILFLVGALKYWKRDQHRILLVFSIALIAYFVLASSGHSAADSRMRFPVVPVIILFASYGLGSLLERLRR